MLTVVLKAGHFPNQGAKPLFICEEMVVAADDSKFLFEVGGYFQLVYGTSASVK
jgi:hypothetical protein